MVEPNERCSSRIQHEIIFVIRDEVFSKLPKWVSNKFFDQRRVKKLCDRIVDISNEYINAVIDERIEINKSQDE